MRFLVGRYSDTTAVYVIDGDAATNLTAIAPDVGKDLLGVIQSGRNLKEIANLCTGAPTVPVSSIEPALPVARPGKFVCLGLNYLDHIKEGGRDVPEYPVFFMRAVTSLIPASAAMIRPSCSDTLDYEAEMLVIIGKGGKNIREKEALSHVFGYTVFNDGSVREYQAKTHQWTAGKNFDGTGAVGPVIVTPDELPDGGEGLRIECRVGGEVLQSATTDEMMWSVARTIETISEFATLEPGDMIATGTPPGVGMARQPKRWLRPGETVEVEIERICVCRNLVTAAEDLST